MDDAITLTKNMELIYSTDDGGFYLQEYKLDRRGTTRTSEIYKSKDLLLADWRMNKIKWGKWY